MNNYTINHPKQIISSVSILFQATIPISHPNHRLQLSIFLIFSIPTTWQWPSSSYLELGPHKAKYQEDGGGVDDQSYFWERASEDDPGRKSSQLCLRTPVNLIQYWYLMHVETEGVTDAEHGDNNEEDDCILLVLILDAILLDKHKDPPDDDKYEQERNKPQDYQICPVN